LLKDPLNQKEYTELANRSQSTLAQLLNTKSPTFKKLGIKANQLDDQLALKLMIENPRLMVRPVLVRDNGVLSRFKEEEYNKFFS
jgi:arsenate reductase-like glutaredoxin family protein